MNKTPTLFLRLVVWFLGLAVLAVCIFVLPQGLIQEWHTNLLPVVISLYVAAIPFFIALLQTLKLLSLIDKNKAFSEVSVTALQRIKYCSVIVGALFLIDLPYFRFVAEAEDAPGLLLIGAVFAGGPIVIAVFAAVLQKLLRSAIDLKKENDLTV